MSKSGNIPSKGVGVVTASEIIQAMGGATELSKRIGASRSAISNWPRNGIPGRWWPIMARVAAERGLALITLEVIESHRSERGRVAGCITLQDPAQQRKAA